MWRIFLVKSYKKDICFCDCIDIMLKCAYIGGCRLQTPVIARGCRPSGRGNQLLSNADPQVPPDTPFLGSAILGYNVNYINGEPSAEPPSPDRRRGTAAKERKLLQN